MRDSRVLGQLEALAEKLEIEVSYVRLSPNRGGLCKLRDQYLLLIDKNSNEEEQVQVFLSALCRFPLDHLQILPRVRQMLEAHQTG
jgi:hypothetical protein